jgi:hypothetical protein
MGSKIGQEMKKGLLNAHLREALGRRVRTRQPISALDRRKEDRSHLDNFSTGQYIQAEFASGPLAQLVEQVTLNH